MSWAAIKQTRAYAKFKGRTHLVIGPLYCSRYMDGNSLIQQIGIRLLIQYTFQFPTITMRLHMFITMEFILTAVCLDQQPLVYCKNYSRTTCPYRSFVILSHRYAATSSVEKYFLFKTMRLRMWKHNIRNTSNSLHRLGSLLLKNQNKQRPNPEKAPAEKEMDWKRFMGNLGHT